MRAISTAAAMISTGMPFFMVMVIAMEIFSDSKIAIQQSLNNLSHISFSSADNLDTRLR